MAPASDPATPGATPDSLLGAAAAQRPLQMDAPALPIVLERVAYLPDPVKLEDNEAGYPSPDFWERLLELGLPAEQISIADLCDGCLARFTVLCVPGGFVLNYQNRLGAVGAALIAEFVNAGGGYVGVCAGAFLGSTMGLGLLPVDVVDATHWDRGSGDCRLSFTEQGQRILGARAGEVCARYANGPILRATPEGVTVVHTLAHFDSEFRAPVGAAFFMAGSPAIVSGTCGSGLVVLLSPHLEDGSDEAARTPFRNAIRLCSSFCQHVRSTGAGPEQVRALRDGVCRRTAQHSPSSPEHCRV